MTEFIVVMDFFLQFSFQIWMLSNHFYHDLHYGLLQLLLQNEVLWCSPRQVDD